MHTLALMLLVQDGEEVPAFYSDPLYKRFEERKAFTTLLDNDAPEYGTCWAERDAIWISPTVHDER